MAAVAVLIVGYRNADDIAECLQALAELRTPPSFEIFIAENGGAAGMEALITTLDASASTLRRNHTIPVARAIGAVRYCDYQLISLDGKLGPLVHIAELSDNVGYAGGINAWLRRLRAAPEWEAVWILNPDTSPDPTALAELAAYAKASGKGMVGSCIIRTGEVDKVSTRGLRWDFIRGRPEAIDRDVDLALEPDATQIEAHLTAPSGASFYVTRELIDAIGLMDERYFLYVEDLEWGERAKRLGLLGYAHRSRVTHKGGTTIGSARARARRSKLSVYLGTRNIVLFIKNKHPLWLPWTVVMQAMYSLAFGAVGAFANMAESLKGIGAGLRGEIGRPERFFN